MRFMKEPAVYLITCIDSNNRYVGSTVNMYKRWVTHRSFLNSNKHSNINLQEEWNIYGENSFTIAVIESPPIDTLRQREKYWIFRLEPEYNIIKESNRGKIRTEYHKEQIRIANSSRTKTQREQMANKCARTYFFLSPDNVEVMIFNLKKFCREHDLDLSSMLKVSKGRYRSYKGWRAPII